ncbi:MAG: hypothetical protein JXR97_07310 [Planctomycetes bacterium]|nr:hypothetical protein [Planctomycetota bacterium]
MMRSLSILLIVFALSGFVYSADKKEEARKVHDMLRQAQQKRYGGKEDQTKAIEVARAVIGANAATTKDKIEAFDVILYVQRRNRNSRELISLGKELRALFPGDASIDRKATYNLVDTYWDQGKKESLEAALPEIRDFIERNPNEKEMLMEANLKLSRFCNRMRLGADGHSAALAAFELSKNENKDLAASALWEMQEAAKWMKDDNKALEALRLMIKPEFIDNLRADHQHGRRRRYADVLLATKNGEELRTYFSERLKVEENTGYSQEWAWLIGDSYRKEENWGKAVEAFDKVFIDHPAVHNYWKDAQTGIADAYEKMEKWQDALGAQHVLLDVADNRWSIENGVRKIAELMTRIDGNIDRANAYLQFHISGPAGPDNKPGSEDDLKNPAADLPYTVSEARRKSFAQAQAGLGDNARACEHRAWMAMYSGQPKEALRIFSLAFLRATGQDSATYAYYVAVTGIRTVDGHEHNLKNILLYMLQGPAGKDMKAGTEDDLKSPFGPYASMLAKDTDWLPGVNNEGRADLKRLGGSLLKLIRENRSDGALCKEAAYAVRRLYEFGPVYEGEDVGKWALEVMKNIKDDRLLESFAKVGQTCVSRKDYSLGQSLAFWEMVGAEGSDIGMSDYLKRVRKGYLESLSRRLKNADLVPRLKLYKEPKKPEPKKAEQKKPDKKKAEKKK